MKHVIAALLVALFAETLVAATFTVTNNNDAGAGSLRDAVAQSNTSPGADTINFAVTGTILLTTGQLGINGPLTIAGPGPGSLTIDANANSRVFSVFENVADVCVTPGVDFPVAISGLTLTNARNFATSAGAVYSEKTLSLNAVVIRDSAARAGGGLSFNLVYPGQALTIANSQFIDNVARKLTTDAVNNTGGGLRITEQCSGARTTPVTVTIANSLFTGNSAQPTGLWGQGGAIATFSDADITITDTRVVGNSVTPPNPPVGGALYYGGGIYGRANSLRIERSEISDNSAVLGGGMRFYNDLAASQTPVTAMSVKLINSTVSGNFVSTSTGGGIELFGNVALEVDNSTVSANSASAANTGGIRANIGNTNPGGATTANPAVTLVSSIVAGNVGGGVDIGAGNIPGFVVNASQSLVGAVGSTVTVIGTGNLLGPNPQLGPLMFNGGNTRTQAVLSQSPVIEAGSNPLNLTTDQRGILFPRVVGNFADMGAYEYGNLGPAGNGFAQGTTFVTSAVNAAPTGITSLAVVCPATGILVVTGSGESAAKSNFAGSAFIGIAYSIARDNSATDNSNVVQSSALATFSGDANRDFLNVRRFDSCTPGQSYTYFLTAYATTPQTSTANGSFVWNGRLTASGGPAGSSFAAGATYINSATNATPTVVTSLPVTCPASGAVAITGSGESAAVSGFAGNAFIGLAYSIARNSTATDNGNVVQSSALAVFNGDANRDFLNVNRVDSCTPGLVSTYYLTVYATTAQTNITNASFVWNGRLSAIMLPVATSFASGTTLIASSTNATPTLVTSMNIMCPTSGTVVVSGSGESAAKSSFAGNAFIGLAYSIARDGTATDNGNVVQSSALAVFNGDANRDFLNVQRSDVCTPGQFHTYNLTAYATTPQTSIVSGSFLFNGRLVAILPP